MAPFLRSHRHDLAEAAWVGAPVEYWFFRTSWASGALLVDIIHRRTEGVVELRVASWHEGKPSVRRIRRESPETEELDPGRVVDCDLTLPTSRRSCGPISWDLKFDVARATVSAPPAPWRQLSTFDLSLTSWPRAKATGDVTINGRTDALLDRPSMLCHYWAGSCLGAGYGCRRMTSTGRNLRWRPASSVPRHGGGASPFQLSATPGWRTARLRIWSPPRLAALSGTLRDPQEASTSPWPACEDDGTCRLGRRVNRLPTSAKALPNPSAPTACCWSRPVRHWRKAWPPWRFEMRNGLPAACQKWTQPTHSPPTDRTSILAETPAGNDYASIK